MTTTAMVMMLVAMLLIWGGLLASIVNLMRSDRARSRSDALGAESHRDL